MRIIKGFEGGKHRLVLHCKIKCDLGQRKRKANILYCLMSEICSDSNNSSFTCSFTVNSY